MKTLLAKLLNWLNIKPHYSTGLDYKTTCGYGKLDSNGEWEYPLY